MPTCRGLVVGRLQDMIIWQAEIGLMYALVFSKEELQARCLNNRSILTHFWKLEVWDQDVSRVLSFWWLSGESLPCLCPRVCWHLLVIALISVSSSHSVFSLCTSVSKFSYVVWTSVIWIRSPLDPSIISTHYIYNSPILKEGGVLSTW